MAAVIKIQVTTDGANGIGAIGQELGELGESAHKASGGFSALGEMATGALRSLGRMGLSAVIDGVKPLASGMISGNAQFETYQTQFGVLLHSADAAKQRLKDLADFGAKPPFELPELVSADKVLTAFG